MENFDQPLDIGMAPSSDDGLRITPEIRHYWKQTSQWAQFFAILLFIVFGLFAVIAFYAASSLGAAGVFSALIAVGIYGAILLLPGLYYYRFSTQMQQALNTEDTGLLNEAFLNLKRYYRYIGILVVVVIAIYLLFILIFGAALMSAGNGLGEY